MIEQTSIELSETRIHAIRNIQEAKNELLVEELINNTTAIENMISGYYYESRGKVYGLNLKKDSIVFEDNLRGYLTLDYSINYFMGCQDLTYDDKNNMRIDFEINIPEKVIKLSGENIREREPDTY